MVDYDTWLAEQGNTAISDSRRAVKAWKRIQRDADSITIKRNATTLDAQTVRLTISADRREESFTMPTTASSIRLDVWGVRNHPTVTDTDIQRGDMFRYNGLTWRVDRVEYAPGEIRAVCEAKQ